MVAISTERDGDQLIVRLTGPCRIDEANRLDQSLGRLAPGPAVAVRIDLTGVDELDTAGAWVVHRTCKRLRAEGCAVRLVHGRPALKTLLDLVAANDRPVERPPPGEPPLRAIVAHVGRASYEIAEEARNLVGFLGLDPMEILVLPRVLALVLTLPLLVFFADIMGLLGGALVSWLALGISLGQFIERLSDAVPLWSFWVGIIKAPVFAFLIAMVGCYEGFQVEGSAESVGRLTTQAVVEAIFLVIIVDALFSILFAALGI